jgi:hypothetical protein
MTNRVPSFRSGGNSEELFPELVAEFQSAGVAHEYRRATSEVRLSCAFCRKGNLTLEIERRWHFCFSPDRHCPTDTMDFSQVVAGILGRTK